MHQLPSLVNLKQLGKDSSAVLCGSSFLLHSHFTNTHFINSHFVNVDQTKQEDLPFNILITTVSNQ